MSPVIVKISEIEITSGYIVDQVESYSNSAL